MATLNPVNLETVLADLGVVVEAAMALGGKSSEYIDFDDPTGFMPTEMQAQRERDRGFWESQMDAYVKKNGYRDDDPKLRRLAQNYFQKTPEDFLHFQVGMVWDNFQTSCERLGEMLEDGNLDSLACHPLVIQCLKNSVWPVFGEVRQLTKPECAIGRPDSFWAMQCEDWCCVGLLNDARNRLGELIRGLAGSTADGAEAAASSPKTETSDPDEMVSPSTVARRFELDEKARGRLRKSLAAWRSRANYREWIEVVDRKSRQSPYLYRLGSIQHLIDAVKSAR